MKATELRIGNLVNNNNKPVEIRAKHILGINNNAYEFVEPIPLTEEWLVKFGFEKYWEEIKEGEFKGFKSDEHFYKDWIRFYNSNDNFYQLKSITGYVPITIQYVHQLQNLYFALTGEELTIKD